MLEEKVYIEKNEKIFGNYFLLKLKTDKIAELSRAGNFIMLAVSNSSDPLLKRPFGVFDTDKKSLYIFYEIVGRGTKILSEKKEGEKIDIIGPLGNELPEIKDKNILMIAGGMGIVPLHFGLKKYIDDNRVHLIYGARSKNDINFIDRFKSYGLNVNYYTDDGSFGNKGFVNRDLKEIIKENEINITISCGPEKMFESIYEILKNEETEDFVSMEAFMGCGIGICHSCVIETVNGYKKVCTDGPVFKTEEIKW